MATEIAADAPGARAAGPRSLLPLVAAAWRWPALAALVFLLAHLPFLASTLDDIDPVNFAFGVRSYDPAQHHPHPPGYPVYIALGKISTAVLDASQPATPERGPLGRDRAATALAFWSALFGALGVLAWYAVFSELEFLDVGEARPAGEAAAAPGRGSLSLPLSAALLTAAAPLTWFTASRPATDVPGLVAATIVQAMLLVAWRRENAGTDGPPLSDGLNAWLIAGAFAGGVALGLRSQVMWLTLPFLAAVLMARSRRVHVVAALPALAAYAVGVLAWAVPMLLVTGWQRYLGALGGQGAEDFSGVDMLWTHPGLRRFVVGLVQTFVLPWTSVPLALVVLVLALAGTWWHIRHARIALAVLALFTLPYTVFHLLFHETLTTRYALPVMPAVCYLAVRGARVAGRRSAVVVPAILVAWCLALVVPAVAAYSSAPAPIFQVLRDLHARSASAAPKPVLGMHRRIRTESRQALNWAAVSPWLERLPSPQHAEWAAARASLLERPAAPVWFLGEPSRTGELRYRDLALVDPQSWTLSKAYRWSFGLRGLLDGARPDVMDLYQVSSPGWIAGEGWALTPATGGLAARARKGPSYGPIEAAVRRRTGRAVLVLGGRHLGTPADGPARIEARIDGRPVADFAVPPEPRFFVTMTDVPAGALSGGSPFATLDVRAAAADGSPRVVPVAIEQFDIQDSTSTTSAYDTGWQEPEYGPDTQLMWRWMSERAMLRIHAGDAATVRVRVLGESPRKYFDRPVTIRLLVGERELARTTPEARWPRLLARAVGGSPFTMDVTIDRGALEQAGNRVALVADQFFVPAASGPTGDRRHLSARIYAVSVTR